MLRWRLFVPLPRQSGAECKPFNHAADMGLSLGNTLKTRYNPQFLCLALRYER